MSASGSNLRITYIDEATWGVTPANPSMKVLRGVTSESLGGSQEALTSNEINSNRGVSDQKPGQVTAGGDISFELSIKGAVALLARLAGKVTTTGTGPFTHEITVADDPTSLTIEKLLKDKNSIIAFLFRGCMPNSFNLTVNPAGIATGSVNFLAKSYESTNTELDSDPIDAVHSFADGIRFQVQIGGVVYDDLSALSISGTNNLTASTGLGSNHAVNMASGRFDLTGNFSLPLTVAKALPLITKAVNGVEDSLKIKFFIGTETIEFVIPRISYSGDVVPKTGGPGIVNLDLNFTALLDNDEGSDTYNKSLKIIVVTNEATL